MASDLEQPAVERPLMQMLVEEVLQPVVDEIAKQVFEATKQAQTDRASKMREAAAAHHRARARELRDEGLSAPVIGTRMAREDGRSGKPYSKRTVQRWLATKG